MLLNGNRVWYELEGFWEFGGRKMGGAQVAECLQERMDRCWQLYSKESVEWETVGRAGG